MFRATMAFLFVLNLQLSAQEIPLFETIQLTPGTKLIGYSPANNNLSAFTRWNFCIEDPVVIKKVLQTFTVGEQAQGGIVRQGFRIALVQNHSLVKSFLINRVAGTALIGGRSFEFDTGKISALHVSYPLLLKEEIMHFADSAAYNNFSKKRSVSPSLLFQSYTNSEYEGHFDLVFEPDAVFDSPVSISTFLHPLITEITGKEKYRITHQRTALKQEESKPFIMTIYGSKKLFDQLTLKGVRKGQWKAIPVIATFYFKLN